MEPIPLQNCLDQLESLNYSPIIGNKLMSHTDSTTSKGAASNIPTFTNLMKPPIKSSIPTTKSSPVELQKKRLFSETSPPSSEKT